MAQNAPPLWDRTLHRRLVAGEAAALGEAYDRFASLVHGLAHHVLADEAAAGRITSEVFGHLWAHPEEYDPALGPLRYWLAELTHHLAVQRVRSAGGAVPAGGRRDPYGAVGADDPDGAAELERTVRRASTAARADRLVTSMPAPLRAALDLAYFERRDCRQAAADLGISEAETHQRLRLGLRLIATAHGAGPTPPSAGAGPTAPSAPDTTPSTPDAPSGHGHGRPM
ncbi:RNA polymerase sigma factor [Streptomyces odontomachi]|uniref:RNA polymerase sigma factor n=1 Tax=Streptomyces odontomachi TaxID=2944940 RepID=UPI00210A28A6|nr:sigma factor [Streptomyces sp. ODS25]